MNIFKDNPYVDGKKIDVQETDWEENTRKNTVILKNLGFENTIEDIRQVFTNFDLNIITMLRDEDGFGKGEAIMQQIKINKRNILIGDYSKVYKLNTSFRQKTE